MEAGRAQAGAELRMVGTPSACASWRPNSTVGSASSSWVTKMAACWMRGRAGSTSAGEGSKQAPGTARMAFFPAGEGAKGIAGELADEADMRAGARGGDCLVGAFATGTEREADAHGGLAPGG